MKLGEASSLQTGALLFKTCGFAAFDPHVTAIRVINTEENPRPTPRKLEHYQILKRKKKKKTPRKSKCDVLEAANAAMRKMAASRMAGRVGARNGASKHRRGQHGGFFATPAKG